MKRLFSLLLLTEQLWAFGPGTNNPPIWGPDIITVTSGTLATRRTALTNYIWGTHAWPTNQSFTSIAQNINYSIVSYLKFLTNSVVTNLAGLDLYSYNQPMTPLVGAGTGTLTNFFYFLRPTASNNALMIYNTGHASGALTHDGELLSIGWPTPVIAFVNAGFHVIAHNMPLWNGLSSTAIIDPGVSTNIIATHDDMFAYLEKPYRHFFDDLVVALEWFPEHGATWGTNMTMSGLSGGGLLATLYPALDPRIKRSFPVSGAYSLNLILWPIDGEQVDPGLFTIANFSELSAMGASNGEQLQCLTLYDDCCFYGMGWTNYHGQISVLATALGGNWHLGLDRENNTHRVSTKHLSWILGTATVDPLPISAFRIFGISNP